MIVDASVAIKWLVVEEQTDLANALAVGHRLIAPDLIVAEIANTVWKKWTRKELSGVPQNLPLVLDMLDEILPLGPFALRAAELAIELNHPAYDCFYLAMAESLDEKLVTADLRFLRKIGTTPYAELVISLSDTVK
jgi:predicted nucleic acid-binding protein